MEEGVPPLPARTMPCPNPPGEAGANVNAADSSSSSSSTAIVPFPFDKSTYVVQIPKDQIFRVPPPENARIVEERKNRVKDHKNSPHLCSRMACKLAILLAFALLCLGGGLLFYFVARTGAPHFSVDRIVIAKPSSTKQPELFDVTMKSQNPSATMDFRYKSGGTVELLRRGKQIASGDPPAFTIGHKSTTEIKLSLRASKNGLPKEFNSTAKGSKDVFPISLSADFPVKAGLGALQIRKKDMSVSCDLKVSKLAKELHVVSQKCKAKF